jgi:alpha 1,2-mannosyltransferase
MKPPHRSPSTYLLGFFFLLSTTLLLIHYTAQPNYTSYVPTFIHPAPPTLEIELDSPRRLPQEYKPYYPTLALPDELLVHPELYRRLHAFLARPVRGYWEAQVGNERQCPRNVSDELVNPDQLQGDGEFWRNDVDEERVRKERVGLVDHLAGLVRRGQGVVWEEEELTRDELDAIEEGERDEVEVEAELAGLHVRKEVVVRRSTEADRNGRGIVTTGGNADTLARLITLLQILREEYHSTLPIEIWTFPGEIDPSSTTASTLTSLGATIQTVPPSYGLTKDPNLWKNFQIKGLALALSSYKELIYLDSDNIPLRDPEYLFDSTRYNAVDGGKAAFWPDLSRDHVDNAIWRVMGVECDLDDFTLESGQIVIDKVSRWMGVSVACREEC